MIAQAWAGAPEGISKSCDGRLIVHRISINEPISPLAGEVLSQRKTLKRLAASTCPSQLFAWQAARYAEALIETEPIDIIEGQEWEAPLYYLQARRAAGLGPKRQPPCIVHLHSPSQMIFRYNEWDESLTDFLPLCRFEEYTIRAADALVCPSRYLADGVADLFGLDSSQIEIIPYPMGIETPILERGPEVWARDAICYVGRLELRKGVVEWVDAAVSVATTHATVTFDFYGSDTFLGSVGRGGARDSVLDFLKARIPASMLSRFHFHGSRSRADLIHSFAGVAVAVVPSRWENLPFTCIEAMSTGLPVLVSPNGGMAELISDGDSGWVAQDGTPAGLEAALLRVLATAPAQREAMGKRAAKTVRSTCANDAIVAGHIAMRSRVAQAGSKRSRTVAGRIESRPREVVERRGLGIVVTCFENLERIPGCLEAIAGQSLAATAVLVVDDGLYKKIGPEIEAASRSGVPVLNSPEPTIEAARRIGLHSLLAAEPSLRSVVFIDQDVRLDSSYAASCESVLGAQPQIGLVSPWILREAKRGDLDPGPCPVSLNDVAETELPMYSAIRVEALLQKPATVTPTWSTLADGAWYAFTYPGPLVTLLPQRGRRDHRRPNRYSGMALIQSPSALFVLQWFWSAPLLEKFRCLASMGKRPQRVIQWFVWRLRGVFS
jgi:glycosyltransferase involved in cell wall biosynthesis